MKSYEDRKITRMVMGTRRLKDTGDQENKGR